MKKTILLCSVVVALSGCGQKVDASDPQSFVKSLTAMTDKMSTEQKAQFHDAMVAIAADGDDPSPLLAEADTNSPLFWGTANKIKGLTAPEIVRLGYQTELNGLDKAIADDTNAIRTIKAARQKYAAIFDNIRIAAARYHVEGNEVADLPVISFQVTNGSKTAIKKVYLHGVLTSPGRSVPWVSSDLNYEFPGGLEPGETKSLDLEPNMFGDWKVDDGYSRRPDLNLALSVSNVADASGQDLLKDDPGDVSEKQADIAARQRKRAAVQAQIAKIA